MSASRFRITALLASLAAWLGGTAPAARAQGQDAPVLRAEAAAKRLLPCEPLQATASLANPTGKPVAIPGSWTSHVFWEFQAAGDAEWQRLRVWWLPQAVPPPPGPPEPLGAGQSVSAQFWFYTFTLPSSGRVRPLFEPGRAYRVRAVLASSADPKLHPASNAVEFTIAALPASEQRPYEALVAAANAERWYGGLYNLLPENPVADVPQTIKRLEQIAQFIGAFPDSRYAFYCRRTYVLLAEGLPEASRAPFQGRIKAFREALGGHAPPTADR